MKQSPDVMSLMKWRKIPQIINVNDQINSLLKLDPLDNSYQKLINNHKDFDQFYYQFFQTPIKQYEHYSSKFRPYLMQRKMVLPDDVKNVFQYRYPNNDIKSQALKYDVGEQQAKLCDESEALRMSKKINFQLSKILIYNKEYIKKRPKNESDQVQEPQIQIKITKKKIDYVSQENQRDDTNQCGLQATMKFLPSLKLRSRSLAHSPKQRKKLLIIE